MAIKLKGKFILAPMAGITDNAFRNQCKKNGAALVVTELTSVEGIVRREKELEKIIDVTKKEKKEDFEKPAIQLFGNDIKNIVKAAKILEPYASIIDFNLGCPAPNINSQMAGAALLSKPKYLEELFTKLVKAVKIPVTAKIRAGPTEDKLVYKKVALILQKAGVQMITLHPRTIKQGYRGKSDWKRIKELVEILDIPVCGNGDVTTPIDAKKMMEETGCEYVMIGRAARGNPYLFTQCNDYIKKGTYKKITRKKQREYWEEYLKAAIKNNSPIARLKNQAQNYIRGFEGAKQIREQIVKTKSIKEIKKVMKEF